MTKYKAVEFESPGWKVILGLIFNVSHSFSHGLGRITLNV